MTKVVIKEAFSGARKQVLLWIEIKLLYRIGEKANSTVLGSNKEQTTFFQKIFV